MTQDDALKVLTMGKNVFLTGAAGSGKTYLLDRYTSWLRARGITYAVTASTGIAATHIGGQTIHSWSGIGIKNRLTEYDIDRIEQDEKLVKRFQKTHVLIIDEISMLSADTFTMVNQSIQAGLQSHEPFGGMQVIFCGDFFQLPPIARDNNSIQFAFESATWKELSLNTCYLTEQHRQDDTDLLGLLNGIRVGTVSTPLRARLTERVGLEVPENIPHLYTHNIDVDELNNQRLSLITHPPRIFRMTSKGSKGKVETLKKGLLVSENLTLKKDAVVMFVKNHPQGLYVNGTLGTVTGFTSKNPIVKTHEGEVLEVEPESWRIEDGAKVLAEVTQIPLRLAWAVTVHKSQGLTLDSAYIDLTKTFVEGQGYVALSRVRSFSGLYLKGISDLAFARHPAVARVNTMFEQASERTENRLKKTDQTRINEISKEFILEAGGHEPDPNANTKTNNIEEKLSTYDKTERMILMGLTIEGIAQKRKLSKETIISHIEKLLEKKKISKDDIEHIRDLSPIEEDAYEAIATSFAKKKTWNLSPIRQDLENAYTFEEIRFARLFLKPWGNV